MLKLLVFAALWISCVAETEPRISHLSKTQKQPVHSSSRLDDATSQTRPADGDDANAGICTVNDTVYYSGDDVPSLDGCNSCRCEAGSISCTEKACEAPQGCRYFDRFYSIDSKFIDEEGKACACDNSGTITCDT